MTATDARRHSPAKRRARRATDGDLRPAFVADPATPAPPAAPALVPGAVEYEIRRLSLGAAVRWALAIGATTLAVWWAAIGLFWLSASAFGLTADVESFVQDIGFEGFRLASGPMFLALGILGVVWVVGMVVIATLAVATYNLYASMLGGLRVGLVEHRPDAASAPADAHEPAAPVRVD